MGFITADRKQLTLFGYSLDDFVEESARCRFIVKMVESLDLSGLYADYSTQGGDAFDPACMLATWFLAYSEGLTSTRKLEQQCQRDMHYIYTSAHLKPDHTSLSRFRQRHMELLPGYFVQIIGRAVAEGVSEFKVIGIDGSKLQAACSRRQNRTSQGLEWDLKKVRKRIDEYLQRCDLIDEEQQAPSELPDLRKKIEELKELEETLLERQRQHEKRLERLQAKSRKGNQINLVEPDARSMRMVNGKSGGVPGYNAQLSVDTKTQLIVAAEVINERTDQKQFSKQHRQVEENLDIDSDREYVADAGYHSLDQLAYIEENGVDAVIADPRPEQRDAVGHNRPDKDNTIFSRGMFEYLSGADIYRCPAGKTLAYGHTEMHRNRKRKVYRATACPGCVLRAQCIRSTNPQRMRTVNRYPEEHLAEAMSHKSRSPEGRHRMDLRKGSVEPAFGNLKSNLGFRRFRLRGMDNAKGEFILMCIGHNLNKLHRMLRWQGSGPDRWLDRVYNGLRNAAASLMTIFASPNIRQAALATIRVV